MSVFHLPYDTLYFISTILNPRDLNSLIQTNTHFAYFLLPFLHIIALNDHNGIPAICWAAANGHNSLVEQCLETPVDIDILDSPDLGNTALILAADNGHAEVVETLLMYGADVDICNRAGDSAFTMAVQGNHIRVCELLLQDGGINVNERDVNGDTVLHFTTGCYLAFAAMSMTRQSVRLRERDQVEMERQRDLIKMLLDNGADMNMENDSGVSPWKLVCGSRFVEVIRVFSNKRYPRS